jgi:hypothetical protein
MAELRLCRDCKYYVPPDEHLDKCKYGRCIRSVSADGHPVYDNSLMYVTIEEARYATMKVMPIFGCVEWQQSREIL